jgi:hypothetical protein
MLYGKGSEKDEEQLRLYPAINGDSLEGWMTEKNKGTKGAKQREGTIRERERLGRGPQRKSE